MQHPILSWSQDRSPRSLIWHWHLYGLYCVSNTPEEISFHSVAFRIVMCVCIDLACYPYALEANLTSMSLDKAFVYVLIYCQLPQEIQVNLANMNHMWLVFTLQGLSSLYFSVRILLLVASKFHDYLHYAIYYLIIQAEVSFVRIFTLLNDKKQIISQSDKYKNVYLFM